MPSTQTAKDEALTEINNIDDMDTLHEYIKGNNPSGKEIPIHSLNLAVADRLRALGDQNGIYSSVKQKLLAYGKYKPKEIIGIEKVNQP